MDIDQDYERTEREIQALGRSRRRRVRESSKLQLELAQVTRRLKAQIQNIEKPLTERQKLLAYRHAMLVDVRETGVP